MLLLILSVFYIKFCFCVMYCIYEYVGYCAYLYAYT